MLYRTPTPTLPSLLPGSTPRKQLAEEYGHAYRKIIEARDAFNSITFAPSDYAGNARIAAAEERRQVKTYFGNLMGYFEEHLLHLGE